MHVYRLFTYVLPHACVLPLHLCTASCMCTASSHVYCQLHVYRLFTCGLQVKQDPRFLDDSVRVGYQYRGGVVLLCNDAVLNSGIAGVVEAAAIRDAIDAITAAATDGNGKTRIKCGVLTKHVSSLAPFFSTCTVLLLCHLALSQTRIETGDVDQPRPCLLPEDAWKGWS